MVTIDVPLTILLAIGVFSSLSALGRVLGSKDVTSAVANTIGSLLVLAPYFWSVASLVSR